MGLLRSGDGGHPMMSLINFGLRVCQFILAIATLGLYAYEIMFEGKVAKQRYGVSAHLPKTVTAIVVSCLSLVTAAVFAILPFITADYFHVAICFVWDFVIFCIWCAVFAFFHRMLPYDCDQMLYGKGSALDKKWCRRNRATVWVDLVCLLLWLTTTILGIVGLVIRRRGKRTSAVQDSRNQASQA